MAALPGSVNLLASLPFLYATVIKALKIYTVNQEANETAIMDFSST